MKYLDIMKAYSLLGKICCGIAGGIIGFILVGPLFSIAGVVAGIILGNSLEKNMETPTMENE